MHAQGIVARILSPCLAKLHAKRAAALLRATSALVCGGRANLSTIALYLDNHIAYKHRIKSVDRLLGNTALHQERAHLYHYLARHWLKNVAHWLVVVDWSDATRDQRWQLLRASVVVEARSITLYEEIHPRSKLGNPKVHRMFVRRLSSIVPIGVKVIVMSDAGFHSPWFKLIKEQGWEFVGRLRGRNQVRLEQSGPWLAAREIYKRARDDVRDYGMGAYVQSNPVTGRIVLARRAAKGRHSLNMYGRKRKSRVSINNAQSAREPWLLLASEGLSHLAAEAIVGLYAQRMRIEQSFRDTKNLRVGYGLESSRSRSAERFEMLLLLTHLALFVQRLIGEQAKDQQLELQFMANRRTERREISVVTLGRRILDTMPQYVAHLKPWQALLPLAQQANAACLASP